MPDEKGLLVIPHEWVGGEHCCGCLVAEYCGDETNLICNECGDMIMTVPAGYVEEVLAAIMLRQAMCNATCPHCGAANTLPGFNATEAYICSACGEGVAVDRGVQ